MPIDLVQPKKKRKPVRVAEQPDILEQKEIEEIENIPTTGEKLAATMRSMNPTVIGLNSLITHLQPKDEDFSLTKNDEAKELTKDLSIQEFNAVADAQSLDELRMKVTNIHNERKDDEVLEKMSLGEGLLLGGITTIADPVSLASMSFSGRIASQYAKGSLFKEAGIYGATAATEIGGMEAARREAGSEDYRSVFPTAAGAAALGATLPVLNHLLFGAKVPNKEKFFDDFNAKSAGINAEDIKEAQELINHKEVKTIYSNALDDSLETVGKEEKVYVEGSKVEGQALNAGVSEEEIKSSNLDIEVPSGFKWISGIFRNELTSSPHFLLNYRVAKGKADSRLAILLSKFDHLILPVKNAIGKSVGAKITAADVKEELSQIYGINQSIKHNAMVTSGLKPDKFMQMVDMVHRRTYDRIITKTNEEIYRIKKNLGEYEKLKAEVTTKLKATKTIEEEVTDTATKKKSIVKREEYLDEDFKTAVEEGRAEQYIENEVEMELRRRAEEVVKEDKELDLALRTKYDDEFIPTEVRDHIKTAIKADREYYKYYAKRAKKNGLDKKNTWSAKHYIPTMMNRARVVEDMDSGMAHRTFETAIRKSSDWKMVVKESVGKIKSKIATAENKKGEPIFSHLNEEQQMAINDIDKTLTEVFHTNTFDKKVDAFLIDRLGGIGLEKRQIKQIMAEIRQVYVQPKKMAKNYLNKFLDKDSAPEVLADLKLDEVPGVFKQRSINFDYDTIRYYLQDTEHTLAAYDYKVRGNMALQEVFGTTDRDNFLADSSNFLNGNVDHEINEKLGFMFDAVKGTKQIPDDPFHWSESLARTANSFTFLTSGGTFTKYALSEIGVSIAKNGFRYTMESIPEAFKLTKQLYQGILDGTITKESQDVRDLLALSDALEIYGRKMRSAFSDISSIDTLFSEMGPTTALGKADKALGSMRGKFFTLSGLEGATIVTKIAATRAFMRRFGDFVIKGDFDDLSKEFALRYGLSAEDLTKIKAELEKVGYDGRNRKDFSFHEWEDKAIARKAKIAITRASRDTILRNEDLRKPAWLVDGNTLPIFKTTKLFQSFQYMSHERLLLAGFAEDKAKIFSGMLATSSLLGFAYMTSELFEIAMGNKTPDKAILPWNDNAGKFFRRAAVMNGYAGNYGMMAQAFGFQNLDGGIFAGKFGSSYRDVSMFFGGAPVSKAVGIVSPIMNELYDGVTGEDMSAKKILNATKSAMPYNNIMILDSILKKLIKESTE